MDLITLDWETFYCSKTKYSLKNMTNEAYIRDPRFKAHGVGVKVNDQPTKYYYGTHAEIRHHLLKYELHKHGVLSHHAHFDMAILSWRFGIKPGFILDTLSILNMIENHEYNNLKAACERWGIKAKGDELSQFDGIRDLSEAQQVIMGGYCCNDCDITYELFTKIKPHAPMSELRLIDITVRMFSEPVLRINTDILVPEYKRLKHHARKILKDNNVTRTQLRSRTAFPLLLKSHGVEELPMKVSASFVKNLVKAEAIEDPEKREIAVAKVKAKRMTYAFAKNDMGMKLLCEHSNPVVADLAQAKLDVQSSLKETRTKAFYKMGKRGTMPVYLKFSAPHTKRWSGGDGVNLQNLHAGRDGSRPVLRECMEPPDGYALVVVDLSQIEARMLAWLANETAMLNIFKSGGDPYNHMGAQIYGRPVDRKAEITRADGSTYNPDKIPGQVGKSSVLGCGFGLGNKSFAEQNLVGFLGAPPMVFDQAIADALNVDLGRYLAMGRGKMEEEVRKEKPFNMTFEDYALHRCCAKGIIDKFRNASPNTVRFWKEAQAALEHMMHGRGFDLGGRGVLRGTKEAMLMPNGVYLRYPKLWWSKEDTEGGLANGRSGNYSAMFRDGDSGQVQRKKLYGGLITENVVQALSRIVIAEHKLIIAPKYKVALSTHDEIGCIVPINKAAECLTFMKQVMSEPSTWCADMPLACDGGIAYNYADAK